MCFIVITPPVKHTTIRCGECAKLIVLNVLTHAFVVMGLFFGRAPEAAHAQCGCLATYMGKMLCCRVDLSSRAGHLCGCTYFNRLRAISKISNKWVPLVLCS